MVAVLMCATMMILMITVPVHVARNLDYTPRNSTKYHTVKRNVTIDDILPSECNSSTCVEHFASPNHFDTVAYSYGYQQQMEIRQYMLVPFVVRNYLDLADWMSFCEKPAEIMQSAIVFFKLANYQFQSRRSNEPKYDAHLYSVCNTLFEQIGFNRETISQLNSLASISTEGSDMYTILECYIITQPRVTNTSGSACFNLVKFYQKTFETQQHLHVILGVLNIMIDENEKNETKQKILGAQMKLWGLQTQQAEHMAMLCGRKNSYVIAEWIGRRPTAVGFSDKTSKCYKEIKAGTIRLRNVNGKLTIKCSKMQSRQYTAPAEDTVLQEVETERHNYYFSTHAVSVSNIFREYICEVSIEQEYIPDQEHYLVYLVAKVCQIGKATRPHMITGFTTDSHFHEKLEFPITYNPGRVARHHPTPFHITSMGLYRDEVGRLSINISTSVPPNFV